jgi:hypothetical protein
MSVAPTEQSHVLADHGKRLVKCLDVNVRQFLADELQILLVKEGRAHDEPKSTAYKRRDLDIHELNGKVSRCSGFSFAIKGHYFLRLAAADTRDSQAAANKTETDLTIHGLQ